MKQAASLPYSYHIALSPEGLVKSNSMRKYNPATSSPTSTARTESQSTATTEQTKSTATTEQTNSPTTIEQTKSTATTEQTNSPTTIKQTKSTATTEQTGEESACRKAVVFCCDPHHPDYYSSRLVKPCDIS
jgi:hypothetical protein